MVQQPGLADPGLADEHQRGAHALAHSRQQIGEYPQFLVASGKRGPAGAGAAREVSSRHPFSEAPKSLGGPRVRP
ncbi:hypothetical protein GCM10009839_24140 [Catenulispora yoronensis]|uniref:Uncharacterized protein n=1 Tax=Catenulispora yoronensis TaxID=450799 RepID=A0ABN2U0T6_9ACTN